MIPRIRQQPVLGSGRRLVNWLREHLLNGVGKSQRAFFVTINGQRYKRVVFGDSSQAAEVASALENCRDCVGLPELVLALENEIWVRFVVGRKIDPALAADREALNDFFAALYARDPQLVDLASTPIHQRLLIDLDFLGDCGVLQPDRVAMLRARAGQLKPDQIWLGYDYVDPVLKNFVCNDQGLFAIDIESLQPRVALGTGVAKSALHWLTAEREQFVDRLAERSKIPALKAQLPYVELCFLAGWTKRKLLTGKRARVSADRFERFWRDPVDGDHRV